MSLSADYTPPDSCASDMIWANNSSDSVHVSSPFCGWTAFDACALLGEATPVRVAARALHGDE